MSKGSVTLAASWFLWVVVLLFVGSAQAEEEAFAERYRLGAGDVISVRVFGEDNLSMDNIRLTDDDATVAYPLIGEVRALGRTTRELEDHIRERLSDGYLVNPRVTVNVLSYRQFYVDGAVSSPGGYSYEPGMTVRRAIILAGGTTDLASSRNMHVVSEDDTEAEERRVTMSDRIYPGDILTIEESFF